MKEVAGPAVIRPDGAVFARRAAIGLAAVWPLFAFQLLVLSHQQGLEHAIVVGVGTFAVVALVACAYFLNVRVVVTDDDVMVRGLTGRQRHWPRKTVQGCLLVSVLVEGNLRPDQVIVVHGANHEVLFTLNGALWDERALRAMTHALGYRHHETASFKRPLTRQEYLERYPGVTPFGYKHFWAMVMLVGVLLPLIAVFGGVEIADLVATHP
jgi:hypothetical protein